MKTNKRSISDLYILFFFTSMLFPYTAYGQESETKCENDTVVFQLDGYKSGAIQWQSSAEMEVWNDLDGEVEDSLWLNPIIENYYRAMVVEGTCLPYYSEVFHISIVPEPDQAEVGEDKSDLCSPVTLAANAPTAGSGAWQVVSGEGGSLSDPADPATSFSGAAGNTYTLRWTIVNSCGVSTEDELNLSFAENPSEANAGLDQVGIGTPAILAANDPAIGSGSWSVKTGLGGNFLDSGDPATEFHGIPGENYILEWTISGECASSVDEVNIHFADTATVKGNIYFIGTTIPVEGVKVSIGENTSTSNSQGFFALNGVLTGNHTLLVEKAEFDSQSISINLPSSGLFENIEITSDIHTHTLSGYIYAAESDYPLENALVGMLNPDGSASGIATLSDENGRYELAGVPYRALEFVFLGYFHGVGYDTLAITLDISSPEFSYDCYLKPEPPVLFPLDAIGAQWAYQVYSLKSIYKTTLESTNKTDTILVTLMDFDENTNISEFKINGTKTYPSTTLPSKYWIKEVRNELLYSTTEGSSASWRTLLKVDGSSSWSNFICFLGRVGSSGINMSIKDITANSVRCSASDDNYGDSYVTERYEKTYTHTIDTEVGLKYSKWYDYYNDGDWATWGPYVYSNEISTVGYSIPKDDGSILEFGEGTAVQLIVRQYSPGAVGEYEATIYEGKEPIEMEFSADMDKESVEENLIVYSSWSGDTLEGTFTWKNKRTFSWTPDEDYPEGYINVTCPESCVGSYGATLPVKYTFYFFYDLPKIEIEAPLLDDNWNIDAPYKIQWDSNFPDAVTIKLIKGGVDSSIIVSGAENTGSYHWNINVSEVGTDYAIKICRSKDERFFAISDLFELTDVEDYITVLQPSGGEDWQLEDVYNIIWRDNFPENVNIELLKGGVKVLDIGMDENSDGLYAWEPLGVDPGEDYSIRITNTGNGVLSAESSLFEISEATGTAGTVSDFEGNSYPTTKIGTQWWTASNLVSEKLNDGTDIPLVEDWYSWERLETPARSLYDDGGGDWRSEYGALYNWYTVDTEKLCPVGWHVPSKDEVNILRSFILDKDVEWGYEGFVLKSTSGWDDDGSGTDNYGFNAYPGGKRSSLEFYGYQYEGYYAAWWTKLESSTNFSYGFYVNSNGEESRLSTNTSRKESGLSVRCIKD